MDEKVVKDLIDRLIDLSFAEDIGDGDHTTLSCIPADAMGKSKLLIKEEGILAGIEIAKEVFNRFDPTMKVEVFINDGAHVKPGDVAMVVEGKIQSLLQTERHKKDYSGYAYPRKDGCQDWWWCEPSYRSVRYDSLEGQPCGLCRRYRQGYQPR